MRTKTACQRCGDNFSNEGFELGMCCGLPLVEVPFTKEDWEREIKIEKVKSLIYEEASKLGW